RPAHLSGLRTLVPRGARPAAELREAVRGLRGGVVAAPLPRLRVAAQRVPAYIYVIPASYRKSRSYISMYTPPVDLSAVPQDILTLLQESIIPSPHSINLEHSPSADFLYRSVRRKAHVAELYHENSKLCPYATLQPTNR